LSDVNFISAVIASLSESVIGKSKCSIIIIGTGEPPLCCRPVEAQINFRIKVNAAKEHAAKAAMVQ